MGAKITTNPNSSCGFEIAANREGLIRLATRCLELAALPEDNEQVLSMGNHFHFDQFMECLEPGSSEFILVYKPNL